MADGNQIKCPHCGQAYAVRPEQWPQYAGRTINCTRCGQAFTVIVPPEIAAQQQAGYAQPSVASPTQQQPAPVQQFAPFPTGSPPQGGYAFFPGAAVPTIGNGWAVTSLVFGILGFCVPVISGIVAIITGILGLRKARDPQVRGRSMSIVGIILGAIGIPLSLLIALPIAAVLLPSLNSARERANEVKCGSNMRQLGIAMMMYANSNGGHFPDKLEDVLQSDPTLPRSVFVCPADDKSPPTATSLQAAAHQIASGQNCSYIYIGNDLTSSATSDSVLMYEPLSDHRRGINVLYADGTVKWLKLTEAQRFLSQQNGPARPTTATPP